MQLIFRKFPAHDVPPPGPGEVCVRADPARVQQGQGLAAAVLEHGGAALLHGPGRAECLVVDAAFTHPTLDEMLAATFARRLLEGATLPEGGKPFADYAAAMRLGLRPADVPVEDSIEGIFLAIRNAAGKDPDLTDPQVGERFGKDWERMAERILQAAEQGLNPLTESPFAGRAEFIRERAFLLRDQDVYRSDVLRGERWLVQLPGWPKQASGLVLREPISLLFPYWSRTDRDAPGGGAYLLLAVNWGEGIWMVSTDPAQRLPINSLAERLQGAETVRDPQGAARDPWYDGSRHEGTVVGAPHGGTKLTEREVLRVVKKWAHARAVRPARPIRELAAVAAALVVLTLLVLIYLKINPSVDDPQPTLDGKPIPRSGVRYVVNEQTGNREGVRMEPGRPFGPKKDVLFEIPVKEFTGLYNVPHVVAVTLEVGSQSGFPLAISRITVQINEQDEKTATFDFKSGSDKMQIETAPVVGNFVKGKNTVRVRMWSDSDKEQKVEVQASWPPKKTLHVLTVGVSTYPKAKGVAIDLPNASKDATDLLQAFKREEGGLFHKVDGKALIDGDATKRTIFDELRKLKEKATIYDLVVVALSGHGLVDPDRYWFFTPYDYDPQNETDKKEVFWLRGLDGYIPEFACDVIVFVDTCHSGAVTKGVSLENVFHSGARRGLVVFAASLGKQLAQEDPDWGHGALTLAVLEGIQSEYLYAEQSGKARPTLPAEEKKKTEKGKDDRISLFDLEIYVRKRVKQLTKDDQAVVVSSRADFDTQSIAIARIKKGR